MDDVESRRLERREAAVLATDTDIQITLVLI